MAKYDRFQEQDRYKEIPLTTCPHPQCGRVVPDEDDLFECAYCEGLGCRECMEFGSEGDICLHKEWCKESYYE